VQYVFIHAKKNHVHQRSSYTKHLARPLANFDQSNERGQMPDGARMFSRQIPAYAGLTSGQIPGVRRGGGGGGGGGGDDRSWN
jgi:hypothetical protein